MQQHGSKQLDLGGQQLVMSKLTAYLDHIQP